MSQISRALLTAARPLIKLAIEEDIGPGDATSQSTLSSTTILQGRVKAKSFGVIAGLEVMKKVFKQLDPEITFSPLVSDGQEVVPGEEIARVTGPAPALLAAERIALNFLQRMSGIATLTRDYVDAVAPTSTVILDTRKTAPGFRILDKYAVRMGGGANHRMSLFDMIMIKDNHIDGAGGIASAVKQAREAYPHLKIEVEVRSIDELEIALSIQPPLDRILLDNMEPSLMRQAVKLTAGRVPLEASGGVTLSSVLEIGFTGVDFVSVGALTHSPQALDISMKVGKPSPESTRPALVNRIRRVKESLGDRLLILGHHYQRDEIIELADLRGDSLELSRKATSTDANFIVFCGVHFMAEVAAVLAKPEQHVLIPDPTAGCYLADTASIDGVQNAWKELNAAVGDAEREFTPITYVNSSAALKAFCGKHGGLVCTSGNADRVLADALTARPKVFFFPDQQLGRNTALKMGIPSTEILLWNPNHPPDANLIRKARVILWPGVCNVHQRFRSEHVHAVRRSNPGINVIVHPECPRDVVQLADDAGSTAHIIRKIEAASAGEKWAVGTESRLVNRLQKEHPEQTIVSLADVPPFCRTMGQTTLKNLADVLDSIQDDRLINEIRVDQEIARLARIALERMLAI